MELVIWIPLVVVIVVCCIVSVMILLPIYIMEKRNTQHHEKLIDKILSDPIINKYSKKYIEKKGEEK